MTTTANNRIAHIQAYANQHGFALALSTRSKGLHTIGFAQASPFTQSLILDKAIETIYECAADMNRCRHEQDVNQQ